MDRIITLIIILMIATTTFASLNFLDHPHNQFVSDDIPFQYNSLLAQDLAGFALASYCTANKIKNWSCGQSCQKNPQGLKDFYFLKNSTLHSAGYMGYSIKHQAIVVVFRGTVPWLIENWISDIDILKEDYPLCPSGCQVHSGFYNAFKELVGQIAEQFPILKAKYPKAQVFLTGHSLGAALATYAVPLIYELNQSQPIDAFYIFGSPRLGDKDFSQWFSSQNFSVQSGRVNHNADPVPHIPPQALKYAHINKEVFYNLKGDQYILCSEGESKNCANSVKIPVLFTDHINFFGWNWTIDILSCQ